MINSINIIFILIILKIFRTQSCLNIVKSINVAVICILRSEIEFVAQDHNLYTDNMTWELSDVTNSQAINDCAKIGMK